MNVPVVKVESVEKDVPCRAWEVTLDITRGDERGYYSFTFSDLQWREARDNPKPPVDGDHGPLLVVEKEGAK